MFKLGALKQMNAAGTGYKLYRWKTNCSHNWGYSYNQSIVENFDIYEVSNDTGQINTTLDTVLFFL